MKTRPFLSSVTAALLLTSGLATAASNDAAPAPASKKAATPAKPAPAAQKPNPMLNYNGIRLQNAKDEEMRVKERAIQSTARSKELTAMAKEDLAAKRYKEAYEKSKVALEVNPKNSEAAKIKRQALDLAAKS
ncbi:MAG: hypothetical protein K0S28_1420 [Paucimonas sp.]|jgi:hypothetical protein|nr:hypothetical protein [Paucimonas sp.]